MSVLHEFLFGPISGHSLTAFHPLSANHVITQSGMAGDSGFSESSLETMNSGHTTTSFLFPMMGAPMGGAPGAAVPGAAAATGYGTGYTPEVVKPIDPVVEISRINTNIFIYQAGIAALALGAGISTCLFVKSIYAPARKGFSGGDSDEDADGSDDSDDDD